MLTVSGEPEPERKSRCFNGVEALAVWMAVMIALWPLAFGAGVLGGWTPAGPMAEGICSLLCLFLLLVSPRLHGDRPQDWGLGSPRHFLACWRSATPLRRALMAVLLAASAALILSLNYFHWPEVARFSNLKQPGIAALPQSLPGALAVYAWGLLLSFVFLVCAVRYDNFGAAFTMALAIAVPAALCIALAALLTLGPAAFAEKSASQLLLQAYGYLFWGFLQQLIFSGYFCTRLRRAVPPGGSGRRLLTAILVASIFASIHFPSYRLVLATFLLGLPLAWVFMQDRYRNLVALSFVHAILGTTLNWLFSGKAAGRLFVEYQVGPWNVHEPALPMLAPPLIAIAVYGALILLMLRGKLTPSDRR